MQGRSRYTYDFAVDKISILQLLFVSRVLLALREANKTSLSVSIVVGYCKKWSWNEFPKIDKIHGVWKLQKQVSFNNASEASYVYILSEQVYFGEFLKICSLL